MADKYIIRVTAGSTYDLADHVEVPVNTSEPVKISNEFLDVELNVRVQNYRGLPLGSPETSPYFSTEPHAYNKDQYSLAFRFTPKKPAAGSSSDKEAAKGDSAEDGGAEEKSSGISAADLQFGNDFDHPIRDRLPPGFGTAMNIVKWWIDPGLEGDAYADVPYLYGPALSSFNAVHVGSAVHDPERGGIWVEEGGDEKGLETRQEVGAPADAKQRMKWALRPDSKEKWVWECGRTYAVDFYNPYIDFSEFALRLPGFSVPIMKYWDGQGLRAPKRKRSHQLRYVLRNRSTSDTYLVILFTLYLREDVNEDGSLKPAAIEATARKSGGVGVGTDLADGEKEEEFDEEKALDEARRKLSGVDLDGPEKTSSDDVD